MEKQANYARICVALFLIGFFAPSSGARQGRFCTYQITIKTADKLNAGTTSTVGLNLCNHQVGCFDGTSDITLFGDNGPNYKYFTRGSVDHFTLTRPAGLRCPDACRIELVNIGGGVRPSWFVEEVKIQSTSPIGIVRHYAFEINERLRGNAVFVSDQCPAQSLGFEQPNLELFE